jgi:N-acetylmuramoyl-L-alanine amidase
MSIKLNKSQKFTDFFTKNEENLRKIEFLVFHHIEASCPFEAIKLLKENQVSSHFLIDQSGEIFELVDEKDIAYHAGVSFWNGFESLNKSSIGIEFVNSDVLHKKFSKKQLESGAELSLKLIKKYKIQAKNIVGHSDIAYFAPNSCDDFGNDLSGFLDRKQDPSHLFNWKFFAKNEIGVFPKCKFLLWDEILFEFGQKRAEIAKIKQKLAKIGYKINNFDDNFDLEAKMLVRVFNRHFNLRGYKKNPEIWWKSSQNALDGIF